MHNRSRHPELVSGSILPRYPLVSVARWMLKHVQHDEIGEVEPHFSAPRRLRVNPI